MEFDFTFPPFFLIKKTLSIHTLGRKPALMDSFVQSLVLAPLFVWFELLFPLGYKPKLRKKVSYSQRKTFLLFIYLNVSLYFLQKVETEIHRRIGLWKASQKRAQKTE